MFLTILIGVVIALAAGLAIKYVLPMFATNGEQITWIEFAVGAVIIAVLVVPGVSMAGAHMAKASKLSYKEFWSGYEAKATTQTYHCFKYSDDSFSSDSCDHHYRCDPYTVVKTRTVDDGNGKSHTETYTETHWHHCPETTQEISYFVDTTVGNFTIGDHLLPPNPYHYEWDHDGNIPADLVATAHVPAQWAAAKQRIDSGKPGPATSIHSYDNYILASQSTILKNYSGAMDTYLKQGLLPKVASDVYNFYYADKFYVVGKDVANHAEWTNAVMRFNAAFGTDKQGDLHFVLVNSPKVTNPDDWFGALQAYWQSKLLGKHDISKNGLIVAVGTSDGKTVSWVRAATGMPVGNEDLFPAIVDALQGQPLNPATLIGEPQGKNVTGDHPVIVHSGGALEKAVWGTNGFVRVSMTCHQKTDHCIGNGFSYLGSEIQPSTGQKVAIFFVALFFSLIVWAVFAAVGAPAVQSVRRRSTFNY